jgi:prolyl oligopeptidase
VLINPNSWAKDGATALAKWSTSDDGTRMAYAVQDGGTDWRTIRVLDVDTGKVLDDEVKWARFTSIAWTQDGSGFFYSRYPEPKQGNASQAGVANHALPPPPASTGRGRKLGSDAVLPCGEDQAKLQTLRQ